MAGSCEQRAAERQAGVGVQTLMEHGGGRQRAEESGAGRVPVGVGGALVGLPRLHLQKSQHG